MSEELIVLIIDDNPDDRENYIRALKKIPETKYRCLETSEGKQGMMLVDNQPVDCVLLDYSLPGMNGLQVLKTIRSNHAFLPVILLTGQGNEAVAVQAIKEGAHDYLTKSSINAERLHLSITAAISQIELKRYIADIKNQMQQSALELALSEERYELAVQGMSVGLWDWNIETNELYWSKQFKDIVGVTDEDFQPHYDEFSNRLHPQDKAATLKALFDHAEKHTPYNVEYRLRCNDGHYAWIHACGQAKWNEEGKAVRMVGSVNDISERKKLETDREKLIEKLTQSNSELERFAYMCSHDLQEPLRMISNFSQRLEIHLNDAMDEKARHYLKYVTEGAMQARQLISDVLNFARVDHEIELLAHISCEQVLGSVLRDLNARIEETKAHITHDALPSVYMQPTHLRQLLQNLISNALKFCSHTPHVHVSAKKQDGHWQFYVRDNGIGIAPEHSDKIFAIFQRLHNRESYPGTGIGLALCKKIVQKYEGKIWVESQPGQGSCFFFTLPVTAAQYSEAA